MNKHSIYQFIFRRSEQTYIGRTSRDPKIRYAEHLSDLQAGTHINRRMQAAYDRWKGSDIQFTIIKDGLTFDEAVLLEEDLINYYQGNVSHKTINISKGGAEELRRNGFKVERIEQARKERNKSRPLKITYEKAPTRPRIGNGSYDQNYKKMLDPKQKNHPVKKHKKPIPLFDLYEITDQGEVKVLSSVAQGAIKIYIRDRNRKDKTYTKKPVGWS